MPRLRLALAFALVTACLQARAQSPSVTPHFPVPQPDTTTHPAPSNTFPFVLPKTQTPPTIQMKPAQIIPDHALIAKLNGPCYAMRSYNFTPGDLLSDAPRPSSASNCTATASLNLKQVQGIAAPAK